MCSCRFCHQDRAHGGDFMPGQLLRGDYSRRPIGPPPVLVDVKIKCEEVLRREPPPVRPNPCLDTPTTEYNDHDLGLGVIVGIIMTLVFFAAVQHVRFV